MTEHSGTLFSNFSLSDSSLQNSHVAVPHYIKLSDFFFLVFIGSIFPFSFLNDFNEFPESGKVITDQPKAGISLGHGTFYAKVGLVRIEIVWT